MEPQTYIDYVSYDDEKYEIFGEPPVHHAQPWLKALVDPGVYNKAKPKTVAQP